MRPNSPDGYEQKFAGLIRACEQAKAESAPSLIIVQPQSLGDTYDEIVESLWRLAEARLALVITGM